MSSRDPGRMFIGYRALGFVSNQVPLCVRHHKKHRENYVVTCVGRAFHTYNCSKLGIKCVSDTHPDLISCLALDARHVYSACGREIYAFAQGRKVVYRYTGHSSDVHLLLPFADHLISVDESSCVKIWNIEAEDVFAEVPFDNATFRVTALAHPHTYINKVLFGSAQGALKLWNIRRNELVHSFTGWTGAAVTVLEQSPALDVMGVGLSDGRIILHHLKQDETVVSFRQDWGTVTALAFRTDGHAMLVSGSAIGHIAVWNLDEARAQSQIRHAHTGPVTGLKCLPSEPTMITSGVDNSLKMWIFDQPDGGARLLNQRSGHAEPPNRVRFHGDDGNTLLSAGQDSTLRAFSTVHESLDKSLGRASYDKARTKRVGLMRDEHKMPPIIDFASETARQSDWDGIIACHRGDKVSTTWNYARGTMGAHRLLHPRFHDEKLHRTTVALCVTVTMCGNFCVIGYNSGHADLFNMQSGLHRGSYGLDRAHEGAVLGVSVDARRCDTVTVGADSCVHFWAFKCDRPAQARHSIRMDSVVARSNMHRDTSMLALGLDDCRVFLIDVETHRVVRRFHGHTNSITDLTFSSDGRLLISAAMDSTVKIWDIPSSRLIDCFLVESPVTSLALSPTDDFLATTHVDDLGVYLWVSATRFSDTGLVAFRPLPADYEPTVVPLPTTFRSEKELAALSVDVEKAKKSDGHADDPNSYRSPELLEEGLSTMTRLPSYRWLSLLHLDVIKQRNKPREPPKAIAAPFFLPTIAGLEPKFSLPQAEAADSTTGKIKFSSLESCSEFGRMLQEFGKTKDHVPVLEYMKNDLGPSGTDVELRGLAPEGGGSMELLHHFLELLRRIYDCGTELDLASGYDALFFKLHGNLVSSDAGMLESTSALGESRLKAWSRCEALLNKGSCIAAYSRGAIL